MKTIKKYWMIIVSAAAAFLGFITLSKKSKSKKINDLDVKIKVNDAKLDDLDKQVEHLEDARKTVETKIVKHEETIEALEEEKKVVAPKKRTTSDAKANIVKKTTRPAKKK